MKNNALIITVIIVLGVLILGYGLMEKLPNSNDKTLSSQGTSTIKSMPDEASVYINIETLDTSSEASKNKNQEISTKVNEALKSLEVNKIETSQYSIYEDFDYTEAGRKSKGWKTTNVLKVTVKDFTKIGKIIDESVNSGATGISYVNFELSQAKQKELKKQALEEASNDARAKAEAIAQGLNAKIGNIVSVSTSDYNYMPYPVYNTRLGSAEMMKSSADIDASTTVNPQELEVSANVQVVFEIK